MGDTSEQRWLLVLAGKPGTGKTTLAAALTRLTAATYLRVDAIETAIGRELPHVGAAGYAVAQELALSNLTAGNDVIVDAVNAVPQARQGWAVTAESAEARLYFVETVLPDASEHRRRVEARSADMVGQRIPTWTEVAALDWAPWDVERDGPRVLVDTTTAASALTHVLELVRST